MTLVGDSDGDSEVKHGEWMVGAFGGVLSWDVEVGMVFVCEVSGLAWCLNY